MFRYEVTRADGRVLRGSMDAPSAQDVTRRLTERGYGTVNVLGVAPPDGGATMAPPPSVGPSRGASPAAVSASPYSPAAVATRAATPPVIVKGAASLSIPDPQQLARREAGTDRQPLVGRQEVEREPNQQCHQRQRRAVAV